MLILDYNLNLQRQMNNIISWFQGTVYTRAVKELYQNVFSSQYYPIWRSKFTYIHGEFDTQRKINNEKLSELFEIELIKDKDELFNLIYCLETYYSIVLRILAFKSIFNAAPYSKSLFHSNIYVENGILNYSCVDYYDWFLEIDELDLCLLGLFNEIDPSDIDNEGDAISTIFENIFPKEIRHSVGEYYTPYWLANVVIDQLIYNDEAAYLKKYIDPTCGSGTFLVALINKFKMQSNNAIFGNICGIDINPLTVLAAKTNYLILYCKDFVIDNNHSLEIPIYCADTIAINDVSANLFEDKQEYENVPKQKYDYIVGNPPWVNWEYMPDVYRMKHAQLWQYYGLFSRKGLNTNFIKEDISVLVTYVVVDNYLKNRGKIGFVVKETLFKSIKQGEGFRKFKISPTNTNLSVSRVDDLTSIKPFRDAVTRTAIIYMTKGEATTYPVDYIVWLPKTKAKSFESNSIVELNKVIEFKPLKARPSIQNVNNSGWITESEEEMNSSKFILGKNDLVARTGVFTGGANGIYWLRINEVRGDKLLVSNITERAKNKMKQVQLEIEKEFVFPFLTGNELNFWSYSYTKYILCPHTAETKMYPISYQTLMNYPLTAEYFHQFRKELEERKGFTSMDKPIHEQFYYTLQRIGVYTFARYKVCWRYISKSFTPAVVEYAEDPILGLKNIIGNEKVISIAYENRDEAYYICGVISSNAYRKTIENFMVGTQITPSIINRLNIPVFDATNEQHLTISRLCQEGHRSNGPKDDFVRQIDKIVNSWL